MIALLGALKSETASLRRRMSVESDSRESSCRVAQGTYCGQPIVLATTGMGKERAEAAARLVLDRYSISVLISFGFAGALTDELSIGDIVIGDPWHATYGEAAQDVPLQPLALDAPTRSLAEQALLEQHVDFSVAVGVTVPDLVCDPNERTALAERTGARVVDMESYWIAALAAERHVPFLGIRSISDTKSERLLPFTQLMTLDGRWQAKQTACYFIQRPQQVAVLLRMAGKIHRARRTLAKSIDGLIDGLGKGA